MNDTQTAGASRPNQSEHQTVKERPILFTGPMVRAILDGRKTQTRRVVKPQPFYQAIQGNDGVWYDADCINPGTPILMKYGVVGDRLWVRETFNRCGGKPFYCADGPMHKDWKWKPAIFMRRDDSRITLEITALRVERLQNITEDDAKSEGVPDDGYAVHYYCDEGDPNDPNSFGTHRCNWRFGYKMLWDEINVKNHPWESNPWVWVIQLKRV